MSFPRTFQIPFGVDKTPAFEPAGTRELNVLPSKCDTLP